MTHPLPHQIDGPVGENFDELAKQFPVNGQNLANNVLRLLTSANVRLAFGTETVTFAASAQSDDEDITHGFDDCDLFMVCGNDNATHVVWNPTRVSSTVRRINAVSFDGSVLTGDYSFYWLGLG